ncbi:hypothetical protein C2G38_2148376, partial [Gigaspora rosea]
MSKKKVAAHQIPKDPGKIFKEEKKFKNESINLSKALSYKRKEEHQKAFKIIEGLLNCKEAVIQSQAEYLAAEYYLHGYIKKDEKKAFNYVQTLADKQEYEKALNIFNQISKRDGSELKSEALKKVNEYKGKVDRMLRFQ